MGNVAIHQNNGNAAADHQQQEMMHHLTKSLNSLSLKGRQLFSAEMQGGMDKATKEQPQQQQPPKAKPTVTLVVGDKRRRNYIPTNSFHKEVRNLETKDDLEDDDESLDGSVEDDHGDLDSLPSEIWDDDGSGTDVNRGTIPSADKHHSNKKNRGAWTPEQDDALRAAVERHEGKNWKAIAKEVPGNRTHIQCLQRWGKVLKPGLVKGPWTEEEDDLLRNYVPYEQKGNWVAVAEHVPGRTAKQCRERWSLCLDPNIRKDPWTTQEDDLLLRLHDKHGNAWALIAKYLPGRTENATKSRFKSIERKKDRAWTASEDAAIIRGKAEEKKWGAIAAMLPRSTRTKHAVKIRWRELLESDPSLKRFDSGGGFSDSTNSSMSQFGGSGTQLVPLPPPIPGESSPPNVVSHYTGAPGSAYGQPHVEAMNENAASYGSRSALPQSLSSDKLMNLKVQRNESFEEWLAKEAGGIASVPMMATGSGGGVNTAAYYHNPQQPQYPGAYMKAPGGNFAPSYVPIGGGLDEFASTGLFDVDALNDLDLV
jgi:hypothetical protein